MLLPGDKNEFQAGGVFSSAAASGEADLGIACDCHRGRTPWYNHTFGAPCAVWGGR